MPQFEEVLELERCQARYNTVLRFQNYILYFMMGSRLGGTDSRGYDTCKNGTLGMDGTVEVVHGAG